MLVVIEKGRRVVITCMLVDSNCFDLCHAPKGSYSTPLKISRTGPAGRLAPSLAPFCGAM